MKRDAPTAEDFKLWEENMTVILVNQRADVRLYDSEPCPDKGIKGDCSRCDYYMGCDTDYVEPYVGNTMRGCCWKRVLNKERTVE